MISANLQVKLICFGLVLSVFFFPFQTFQLMLNYIMCLISSQVEERNRQTIKEGKR